MYRSVCLLMIVGAAVGSIHCVEPEKKQTQFSANNFTLLGSLEGPWMDSRTHRAISYFISDNDYLRSHSEANDDCRVIFMGRLATIYTREQSDYIRDRITDIGASYEQIFTGGKYNDDTDEWEWITTETECYFKDWADNEPVDETETSCIVLLGASSSFGWRARECGNKHRFICEISI